MSAIISLLVVVAIIGQLVCWIMTIVKAFQQSETVIGILSICALIGFIMGWVNVAKWNHFQIMVIWSVCLVAQVILQVAGAALAR